MQTLPQPPAPVPGQTVEAYGALLYGFVLSTGVTATMSEDQLVLAEYAGARVSAMQGCLASTYDRLSQVRHQIARALIVVRMPAPVDVPQGTPDERPNVGPMAPLVAPPIVRPPSGDALRFNPEQRARVSDGIAF